MSEPVFLDHAAALEEVQNRGRDRTVLKSENR